MILIPSIVLFLYAVMPVETQKCRRIAYNSDDEWFEDRNLTVIYDSQYKSLAEDIKCRVFHLIPNVNLIKFDTPVNTAQDFCRYNEFKKRMNITSLPNVHMMITIFNEENQDLLEDICPDNGNVFYMKRFPNHWVLHFKTQFSNVIIPYEYDESHQPAIHPLLNLLFYLWAPRAEFDNHEKKTKFQGEEKPKTIFTNNSNMVAIVAFSCVAAGTVVALILFVLHRVWQNRKEIERAKDRTLLIGPKACNSGKDRELSVIESELDVSSSPWNLSEVALPVSPTMTLETTQTQTQTSKVDTKV